MNSPCMKVKCGVENCEYNKSSMCYAEALEVNAMRGSNAQNSEGTYCITFKNQK